MEVKGEEDEAGERGSRGPGEIPAKEPGPGRGDGLRGLGWVSLGGEEDDCAAVGAGGQMGERLLLLVRRQGVLGEGAEHVRVGMLAGLEEIVHTVVSDRW